MPELTQKERIQPSLLDRLTDEAPGERRESRQQRILSMRQLRESVIRDLGWLLNTTCLDAVQDLRPFPNAARSVINYGISGLAGHTTTDIDAASLERMLRRSIEDFEPRFRISSVQVHRGGDADQMGHNAVRFDIEGEVWAQPLPLRLFLKTELDLELGTFDVREQSA